MKKIMTLILMFISVAVFSQTAQEISIITEVNKLRSNPKEYISYVEDFKKMKSLAKTNFDWNKACDETINFLKNCTKVDTLTFNIFYFNKLDTFQSFRGLHTGLFPVDGSENLFGTSNKNITAREVVINLLVDAKVNNKGHRKALLNTNFKGTAVKKYTYDGMTYFIQIFTN